jgi:thiol-disulfide isomerase/thioredoxin
MIFGFAMPNPQNGRLTACGLANALALMALAVGCSQTPPDRVELTLVDRAEFDAVLSRFRGRVVLVDGWATWCGPCVEQLPHSIALAKQHGDDGLEVVTLNFDDVNLEVGESADAAAAILQKSSAPAAHLTNLRSKFGSSTESMDAFEVAGGALPHFKLFDRQGQLRHTYELDPDAKTQFTTNDIDAAVTKLLAER